MTTGKDGSCSLELDPHILEELSNWLLNEKHEKKPVVTPPEPKLKDMFIFGELKVLRELDDKSAK